MKRNTASLSTGRGGACANMTSRSQDLKIWWFESKASPESSLSIRSGRSCAPVVSPARAVVSGPTHLHDRLELHVAVRALPARHQVEHVHARRGLAVLDALLARQLHADAGEERQARDLVPHPQEARVEVDLGRERGDGDQARVADEQERRHRLVEEARVHVRRLLEHDDVAAGPLGGRDLRAGRAVRVY